MNLKYEKKLLKLTVEWQSTKRHHVVFVERAKKRASFLMYTPLCEVAFFPFFLH